MATPRVGAQPASGAQTLLLSEGIPFGNRHEKALSCPNPHSGATPFTVGQPCWETRVGDRVWRGQRGEKGGRGAAHVPLRCREGLQGEFRFGIHQKEKASGATFLLASRSHTLKINVPWDAPSSGTGMMQPSGEGKKEVKKIASDFQNAADLMPRF